MKRRIAGVAFLIPCLAVVLSVLWPRLYFRYIVIHHTATTAGDYESIRSAHRRDHGWRDAAYHLIISNGTRGNRVGTVEASSRYRSLGYAMATRSPLHNLRGLHVCIVGDYTHEDPDPRVRAALGALVRGLQERFWIPDSGIRLHREVSPSECPGRAISKADVRQWIREDSRSCAESLREQHRAVLGGDSADLRGIPRWWLRRSLMIGVVVAGVMVVMVALGALLSRVCRSRARCLFSRSTAPRP
jgi:hypothetical protein